MRIHKSEVRFTERESYDMRTFIRSTLAFSAAIGGALLLTTGAWAQPRRPPQRPVPSATGAARPGVGSASGQGAAPEAPVTAPTERIPTELTEVSPSGLTSDQVGVRAAATSPTARAQDETVKSQEAKTDAAKAGFFPKITGTARYTRLSALTAPPFGTGSLVGTLQPVNTINPTPTQAVDLSFPVVLNNWLLQANITIPISDYFLRINEQYTAATHAETAARYDAATSRAKAASDARVTFYTWLRNRNAVVVAVLALLDQRNHLTDASNQFTVGNASRADVLRA
ncbi:MAG TPA: TolC family protein, partial [Polyangiaceae bacterium]|nr:TolC family protein [Polyangiaceae bacterium]